MGPILRPISRRHLLLGASALLAGCGGGSGTDSRPPAEPARRGLAVVGRQKVHQALPPFAPRRLREVRERLLPLHQVAPRPAPGDWLHDHPEDGQSFEQYLRASPTAPTRERRHLVVQPLGAASRERAEIVALVGTYLALHFGLPTRVEPAFDAGIPPRHARRSREGGDQLLSGWILDRVLAPRLPGDAAALLGFTEVDLWPGEGWNFVFGEASLDRRVGVWSLHRYGDPSKGPEAFRQTLRRALKVAVHETGHMFSLPHCTAFRCVQAGINSLEEEDRAPLWLCPECLPKVAWITSTDPRERLRGPRDFCREHGLEAEAEHFERFLAAIG